MRVLLIDDDIALCELIVQYFELNAVEIHVCHDGDQGLSSAKKNIYDAIVLDLMLPKMSGLQVLKEIVNQLETPVLMLTAKGCDIDQILGLEIGADDYIDKPCNPRVLLARIEAVLKRRDHLKDKRKNVTLEFENLEMNCNSRKVLIEKMPLKLTTSEFNILEYLLERPRKALKKNDIALSALGRKLTDYDRSLDVHVCKLRAKLSKIPPQKVTIENVHGFGYKLEKSNES